MKKWIFLTTLNKLYNKLPLLVRSVVLPYLADLNNGEYLILIRNSRVFIKVLKGDETWVKNLKL